MTISIPANLISILEQIGIASAAAALTYLSTSASEIGVYGPAIAAGATILLNILNNAIGKPVSTKVIAQCCPPPKK